MALKLLIGCDPELFVRNKKTGEFVSAHTLLPGTKHEPYKVDLGALQVDGVAAEFNIDPAKSNQEFTDKITSVMNSMQSYIGADFELVTQPTVEFSETYFKSLPENVRELGCNPDFNAWTGKVNERPDGSRYMRTAAGHIHLGWTEGTNPNDPTHFEECCIVAKQLDYFLGLPSLMWDKDTKRRSLYGCAGAFRPKPYGIEYRTLSNMWLRTKALQSWVYASAFRAVNYLVSGNPRLEDKFGSLGREVIDKSTVWWTKEAWENKDLAPLKTLWNLSGLSKPPIPRKFNATDKATGVKKVQEYNDLNVDKRGGIIGYNPATDLWDNLGTEIVE